MIPAILITLTLVLLISIVIVYKKSTTKDLGINDAQKVLLISFYISLLSTVIYIINFGFNMKDIDASINNMQDSVQNHSGYKYVDPYVTKNGKVVKGHFKKEYSTDPNALKDRARNKYYYQTHKEIIKERRKK